ncbi:MAG: threonylcarbamoyl-AMP synthase [Bacteroidales bacterium]|jgi:L-threonylcarbamoyladenylate synthase|nr:threonylcarbamoyl-AMP synthase [Bacteroidales bacterium]
MYHNDIIQSVNILKQGGIILYPTDTVWGIGCDATNIASINRIYQIKKRTEKQSLLVLVDSIRMLQSYVDSIPDIALKIINSAQKPTSIIYPASKNLPGNLVADDQSIGIRLINDPFCREVIQEFGKPLVSTSANISGEPTPGIFKMIADEIKMSVDYIVTWRQDDEQPAAASAIIKVENDGKYQIIRK